MRQRDLLRRAGSVASVLLLALGVQACATGSAAVASASAREAVGCYRVAFGPWRYPPPNGDRSAPVPGGFDRERVIEFSATEEDESRHGPIGRWRVIAPDTIFWWTATIQDGYNARGRLASGHLAGQMEYVHDALGTRVAPFVGVSIPCPADRANVLVSWYVDHSRP
jgi:hypothetical protein